MLRMTNKVCNAYGYKFPEFLVNECLNKNYVKNYDMLNFGSKAKLIRAIFEIESTSSLGT